MKKRAPIAGTVARSVLLDAALPDATETYTVISHSFVINTIKQMLAAKGFIVTNEFYSATDRAQIAYGVFHINYGDDPELGMLFAFANSYNKALKFSCGVGAYVKVNNTSILSKEGSAWVRMHTGTADQEVADTIEIQIDNAETYFKQLQADKAVMKQITLTKTEYAEFLGRLYIDVKLLGLEQLSLVRKEFEKPSFTYDSPADSLWVLYNHILLALVKSHPRTWMEQQKLIHFHMMTDFELTAFDEDDSDELAVDPNQLDLVDEIEKTEIKERPAEPGEYDAIQKIAKVVIVTEEAIIDLDAEEDADMDAVMIPIKAVKEVIKAEEELVEEIVEEKVETPAEVIEKIKAGVIPKPTMTMKDAVAKYGHLVSEEERVLLPQGKGSEESLNILKQAYLDDQAKAEAKTVLKEVVTEQIENVIKEELVTNASDIKTQLPKSFLPPMPGQKRAVAEEKIIEKAVEKKLAEVLSEDELSSQLYGVDNNPESVIHEEIIEEEEDTVLDVDAEGEIFMAKADLDLMYPTLCLEVGFIVEIGEDSYEITTNDMSSDMYSLRLLTAEPDELLINELGQAEQEDLIAENEPEEDEFEVTKLNETFDIGEPEASANVKLNTKAANVVEEIDPKIEAAIAVMNSKVEITKEEQQVMDAIGIELTELYGIAPNFTYVLKNGQYNVTLESGEVVALTEPYIKTIIKDYL